MRAAYLKLDLLGGPDRRETMKLLRPGLKHIGARFSGKGHRLNFEISMLFIIGSTPTPEKLSIIWRTFGARVVVVASGQIWTLQWR